MGRKKNIQKELYKYFKEKKYKNETINRFLSKGAVIDDTCLLYACEQNDIGLIKCALDHKIIPKKKHFVELFANPRYRYRYTERPKAMEHLFHYGYIPDKEDVILAAKNGVEIPNIERYNVTLDKEVWDACVKSGKPYNYTFEGVDKGKEKLELYYLCRSYCTPKKKLYTCLNKSDIEIDKTAMELLCSQKRKQNIILNHLTPDNVSLEGIKRACKAYDTGHIYKMVECLVDKIQQEKN